LNGNAAHPIFIARPWTESATQSIQRGKCDQFGTSYHRVPRSELILVILNFANAHNFDAGGLPKDAKTSAAAESANMHAYDIEYADFSWDAARELINGLPGGAASAGGPWSHEGEVVPRLIADVTLAADYRASDGRRGALFLKTIAETLNTPEAL
jgi:hypothetical protein